MGFVTESDGITGMIYFTADLHFDDKNILNYENRPFADVEDMNAQLIKRWNGVVTSNDVIYVLGDFGAMGREKEILSSLNGRKILVKGNHDVSSNEYYRKCGFSEVYGLPVIFENFWILSHEPIYVNENMPYANLFGHIHNSPLYKTYSSHHYCVTVERTNYMPISFEEIKKSISENKSDKIY